MARALILVGILMAATFCVAAEAASRRQLITLDGGVVIDQLQASLDVHNNCKLDAHLLVKEVVGQVGGFLQCSAGDEVTLGPITLKVGLLQRILYLDLSLLKDGQVVKKTVHLILNLNQLGLNLVHGVKNLEVDLADADKGVHVHVHSGSTSLLTVVVTLDIF